MKFQIFHYYLIDLFTSHDNIINSLKKINLINKEYDKTDILNLFLKNLFTNWYNIYRKDILENNVDEKIKNYKLPKNILSRLLCMPNA